MPLHDEEEFMDAIEEKVRSVELKNEEREALQLKYGLESGVYLSDVRVAERMGLTPYGFRQLHFIIITKLRSRMSGPRYTGYIVLPPESFGRVIFGSTYERELPTPFIKASTLTIEELNFSSTVMNDLIHRFGILPESPVFDLISADLHRRNISQDNPNEISAKLVGFLESHA